MAVLPVSGMMQLKHLFLFLPFHGADTFARTMHLLAVVAAAYGIYAFHSRQRGPYMFLKTQYVFFDFEGPLILFFMDYLAIIGLYIFFG